MYQGTLDGSKVCIKRVRVYSKEGIQEGTKVRSDSVVFPVHHQRDVQIFYREAVMWKRLTHPNILPLLGITLTPLQLISTWMSGGDLTGYIKNHPDADRLILVRGPPPVSIPCLSRAYPIISYPMLLRASVTSTLATWFMETSKEYVYTLDFASPC